MASRKLTDIIRDVEAKVDLFQEVLLTKIAQNVVSNSPVDTGAYVNSFNFSTGRDSRKRATSSEGRPKMDESEAKGQALDNLMGDIKELPKDGKVYLNNRAPHARLVEDGNAAPGDHRWRRDGYKVFAKLDMSMPQLFEEALQEVGTK